MELAHHCTAYQNSEVCCKENFNEITVIIPVKGDTKVDRTVHSILQQSFYKCEILVLRNSQRSYEIEDSYFSIASSPYVEIKQVLLDFFGKSKTLNYGIKTAKYNLIAVVDADCVLAENALLYAVNHFADNQVFAVGGKLIVFPHMLNILTAIQGLEYSKVFNISRRVCNYFDCNFIISGAFGVFRKDALLSINGYNERTVGEDLELVLRIRRLCKDKEVHKVLYEPRAICFTEAPRTLKALMKQRERWQRGFIDSILRNRKLVFNRDYGLLGKVILPILCIEAIVGPVAMLVGCTGLVDGLFGKYYVLIYLGFQVLLSIIAELSEPIGQKIIPFFIKSVFLNIASMILQLLISSARITGTLLYKKRKMKW